MDGSIDDFEGDLIVWRTKCVVLVASIVLLLAHPLRADESKDDQKYLLRYELQSGQQLHFEVTHVAKTKTRIRGSEESSHVHTISHRHWNVESNDSDVATFDHFVDSVELTQQTGEDDEVRWDSGSGEEAPTLFSKVADQIGTKLSTISINSRGQEKDREDHGTVSNASLGMGSLTLALPEEPIAIGDSWAVPREIKTRTEEGTGQAHQDPRTLHAGKGEVGCRDAVGQE